MEFHAIYPFFVAGMPIEGLKAPQMSSMLTSM